MGGSIVGERGLGRRVLVYGLVGAVTLWLIGPFVWLFVTSVSYQKHLLARPLSLIPPEVTFDNYRMIFGLVRFHAEGQAAKILPSMLNTLIVASLVTAAEPRGRHDGGVCLRPLPVPPEGRVALQRCSSPACSPRSC